MKSSLFIDESNLRIVKKILSKYDSNFKVSAFGSRVNGKFKATSDLDLLVEVKEHNNSDILLASMKEDFELSDLPFRVDLVEASSVSEEFMEEILSELVPI